MTFRHRSWTRLRPRPSLVWSTRLAWTLPKARVSTSEVTQCQSAHHYKWFKLKRLCNSSRSRILTQQRFSFTHIRSSRWRQMGRSRVCTRVSRRQGRMGSSRRWHSLRRRITRYPFSTSHSHRINSKRSREMLASSWLSRRKGLSFWVRVLISRNQHPRVTDKF